MTRNPELEAAFFCVFVQKVRRERVLFELQSDRKRRDFFSKLCHQFEAVLDQRLMQAIPPPNSDASATYALLTANGAPESCYVMSFDSELDGREFPLLDALQRTVGRGTPSILICVPERLAYFEAEQEAGSPPRFLLKRE